MGTVSTKDREGGVRMVMLDRPPANAINAELAADLSRVLKAAREDDNVRAIVLTGAGRFFSGGLDLAASLGGGAGNGDLFERFRESKNHHPFDPSSFGKRRINL